MKFPNAYAGVKKIFTAEILRIIAIVLSVGALIAAIPVLVSVVAAAGTEVLNDPSELADALRANALTVASGIAIVLALAVAAIILFLIAFILRIVGIANSMKDEPAFKISLTFLFLHIVCVIAAQFLLSNGNSSIYSLINTLGNFSELMVTIFIIQGIRSLADRLNNGKVSDLGTRILITLTVIYALIIIANLVAIFASNIAAIVVVIAAIVNLVIYIIFLTYLAKAKKMLAE